MRKSLVIVLVSPFALVAAAFADLHDPEGVEKGRQMFEQGFQRDKIVGTNPVVRSEREACVDQLVREAGPRIEKAMSAQGWLLTSPRPEVDPANYWEFEWSQRFEPIERPAGPGGKALRPYPLVEHREFTRVEFRAWYVPRGHLLPERVVVTLPIVQIGQVIRDEAAGQDRVEISWGVPEREVVAVKRTFEGSTLRDELNDSVDPKRRVLLDTSPEIRNAVRGMKCSPAKPRRYALGTRNLVQGD